MPVGSAVPAATSDVGCEEDEGWFEDLEVAGAVIDFEDCGCSEV